MGELVAFIARSLVDHPDEVSVNEKHTEYSIVVERSLWRYGQGYWQARENCKSD